MNLGDAVFDFEPFEIGYEDLRGVYHVPKGHSPADQIAARGLHRASTWLIYAYDCAGPSDTTHRIDKNGKLVVPPTLIVFGKASQTAAGTYGPPGPVIKKWTMRELLSQCGFSSQDELGDALGKLFGADRIDVPLKKIKDSHSIYHKYEVRAYITFRVFRMVLKSGTLPGDVYLLLPMHVQYGSEITGFCGEKNVPDRAIVHTTPDKFFDGHYVHLPGEQGRKMQREEAKRRVQEIEEFMKRLRESETAEKEDALDEQTKETHREMMEQAHRDIDEYIKY